MDAAQIVPLLRDIELFRGQEERTLREIAATARHRVLPKGESIFIQDQPGETFFVLVDGIVRLYVLADDGRRIELVRHHPPAMFGEIALLDGGGRSASAEVLEQARLVELHRQALLRVVQANPAALEALLRSLGGMVRRTTEQVIGLVFLPLPGRVARCLLMLADAAGITSGRIPRVTQTELAVMVGGARQSVNLALKALADGGCIHVRGGVVEIVDYERLRQRSRA